jgi:hypothetical protein
MEPIWSKPEDSDWNAVRPEYKTNSTYGREKPAVVNWPFPSRVHRKPKSILRIVAMDLATSVIKLKNPVRIGTSSVHFGTTLFKKIDR